MRPRLLQQALGARGIVDAAGTEAGEREHGLVWRAAPFANHVEHLFRHVERDHAMPAHGGELQHLAVRKMIAAVPEPERIFHAVALDARVLAALLRALDRRAHVDRETE